jgi:tetrapyrrole methylase family protein/MazG family protein
VFGEVAVRGVDEVVTNWETIKSAEREDAGRPRASFADVARTLPALPASREIQERASALGWDWPDVEGVWEKVGEELDELRAAAHDAAVEPRVHELGDVLFALANLARWLGVDPEEALRAANRRWVDRYAAVERLAGDRGLVLADLDAAAKDELWNEVKNR